MIHGSYFGLIFVLILTRASSAVVTTARWTIPVPKNATIVLPRLPPLHNVGGPFLPPLLPGIISSADILPPPIAYANGHSNRKEILDSALLKALQDYSTPKIRPPPLWHPSSIRKDRMSLVDSFNRMKNSLAELFRQKPKPNRRALNLNRFYQQYQRGKMNALQLYNAIVAAQERRLLTDPSYSFGEKTGYDGSIDAMSSIELMQDRQVKTVVSRIISNFIGDCVGVVISEVFRKSGEIAGEFARFFVSKAALVAFSKSGDFVSKSADKLVSIGIKRSDKKKN